MTFRRFSPSPALPHGWPRRFLWAGALLVCLTMAVAFAQRQPGNAGPLELAREALKSGRYSDAEAQLRTLAGADPTGDAALELGLLRVMLGRKNEAVSILEPILELGLRTRDARALARAGRAARALGQFREADNFYRRADELSPDDHDINTAWGELFLEKYNRKDAAQSFQTALSRQTSARAMIGLARATADDNPPAALALARKALAEDSTYVPAHLLIAELELDEGRRAEAKQAINKALEINPNSLEAHALVAAIAHLEGRKADFDAEVKTALAINPRYGELFRVAGDHAARNYRFDEAVQLARQALTLDSDNSRASADIGTHLLRTGDEPAARQALERAFKADPYDVITYNLLGLLDTLDKFETITEGEVIIRMHPDEVNVLKEYAMPLAQRAIATFSKKYEFTPKGPILIEIFPRHDDFAVRNVGLPGMIGALGACFGRVVTMDSPRARPPGSFNWGATLWHEIAHVITLQMSNQRVPRWLTEGISVYEETQVRPEWGREMELTFASKLDRNEILKLPDLNAAFTNPETISLAYFEASLLVEHFVDTYGMAGLQKLLRAFTSGVDTDEALRASLGVDLASLQGGFDQKLEKDFGALKAALRVPEGMAGAPLEQLQQIAASNPDRFPVFMALGSAQWKSGDVEAALKSFERAAALVPVATGKESPNALIAEIAIQRGDRAKARAALEALLANDNDDVESARRLAGLIDPKEDPAGAAAAHQRVIEIDPFDATSHGVLGRLALQRKDAATAIREFRVVLSTLPADLAAAHCDLAEAYLLGGQRAEARKQTLAALEVAPSYARAQELLLKIAEMGR
jgi:tetratricopeptide (TPR) repeat protein